MWLESGEAAVSARGIGQRLGVTHSAILYHYGSSQALKDAIAAHAVCKKCGPIVAALIIAQHPAVAELTATIRAGYLARAAG
jgi:AcrR family transcriptional regulator